MNAVYVMQQLGYFDNVIFAYSLPALVMLCRFYASWYLGQFQTSKHLLHYALVTLPLGCIFIIVSLIIHHQINIIIFMTGLAFLNIGFTWSSWCIYETHINEISRHNYYTIALLSNVSMFGVIAAMCVSMVFGPMIIYATGILAGLALWASCPEIKLPHYPKLVARSFNPLIACHVGLSYSTYTIPFILMRHWQIVANTHYLQWQLYGEIILMCFDMVVMTLMSCWAEKYFKQAHLKFIIAFIGVLYALIAMLSSDVHYAPLLTLKICIVIVGCYYNLIVTRKVYIKSTSENHTKRSLSLEQWAGKTVFGKLWLPLTLYIWQLNLPFYYLPCWLALPAIITFIMHIGYQTNAVNTEYHAES